MKIKSRILSFFLALVMVVHALPLTALQVSAAEVMDYYPEVEGTGRYTEVLNSSGELRFAYAFAKNDIPSNDDFRIEWSDDFYKYYTVVKVLSGSPNPGPNTSGSETGTTISKYTNEKSDNYTNAYLDIDKSDLQKYAGKYIKVALIGYNKDESYSCRTDTYFYINPVENEESDEAGFNFSDFWYSKEIELGENLEWDGLIELDNDGWEIVNVAISIKHPDGSAIYYRETDVWDWCFDTEDIQDGSIPTNKKAPKGQHPNNNGGYYEVDDFIIDEPGAYKLFVSVYAKSDNFDDYESKEYTFNVLPAPAPEAPEILDVTVSSSTVRVAEDLVVTVTTNNTVKGIAFFVDSTDNFIGSIENTNGKVTHTFTYRFNKTSNEDANGNDIAKKRRIFAYPMDENGEVLLDAGLVYCDITVNPAKYNFDDFDLNSAQTTKDKARVILSGEEKRFLDRPAPDELHKIYGE